MTASPGRPLVAVAIPTHNREHQLRQAVESALAQDRTDLAVVISDNASTDGTESLGEKLAAADDRVTYIRNPVDIGPTANFNELRRLGGDARYFLYLGDDDWLDEHYVSRCVAELERHPGAAMVTGSILYHDPDGSTFPGVRVECLDPDPARRVLDYYRRVRDNGTFYGVRPMAVLQRLSPMPNAMGNDFLLLAETAFLGQLRTIDTTTVHRLTGGATASLANVARTAGMPRWHGVVPQLAIVWAVLGDIAWRSPVFRVLPLPHRVALAVRASAIVARRFLPEAAVKLLRRARAAAAGRRSAR